MYEPDPATVKAASKGDHAAFSELVRAYQVPIWRFLRQLLGDAAAAEDVAQETFIRAYRRLSSFRHQSKFSTWLFSIARNAGIDSLRAQSRRLRLADAARTTARRSTSGPETRVEIDLAIQTLSPKLREAFLLVEVLGLRYREAAQVMRIPEGTAKSRVFLARAELLVWLGAEGSSADEV
jgi:RNA polymerase sigma-70 factor, ECF subfamily